MNHEMNQLAAALGVHFMGFDAQLLPDGMRMQDLIGQDSAGNLIATDSAYPLVTTSNSGILSMLSTYIEPKIIDVLQAPMKAAEVTNGQTKRGDWTTDTAAFPMIEPTGEVTTYGDYNNGGTAGANFTFPQRQSYHYQVMTQWGERELARAGLAKVNWAAQVNMASVLTINKYQNKTYLFGVAGLQNYGILNDPDLPASVAPNTKAAGGTAWLSAAGAANATPLEVQEDILKLFWGLQNRNKGLVDADTKMTLAMSPQSAVALGFNNLYGINTKKYLADTYPNMRIVTVPEYATASGNIVQLIADEVEGQETATCGFTEKLRAHPIIVGPSDFKQKKSAGTWGAIIFRPTFVETMIGV